MSVDDEIVSLINAFKKEISKRIEYVTCFNHFGLQVEGWLKGEILKFFLDLKNRNLIKDIRAEVKLGNGRKKVDFVVTLNDGTECWFEEKYWLIGIQKGYKYDVNFYFTDGSIYEDVNKLKELKSANKYCLILTSRNPHQDWEKGIKKYCSKFEHNLVSLSFTEEFPEDFFLGLLKLV